MERAIIADSSLELNDWLSKLIDVELVPFVVSVGGREFVDDDSSDVNEFINAMNNSSDAIKSSCPSAGKFYDALVKTDALESFIIVISSRLSGSYNAARLGAQMYLTEHPERRVHVFDSKSAVVGESLVLYKIYENRNLKFDEVVENVEQFVKEMGTMFVLESLDNLVKNGRISKTSALIGSLLAIKPICASDGDGNIEILEKQRGMKKALGRIAEIIGEKVEQRAGRVVFISHTNSSDNALFLKNKIETMYDFERVEVFETKILSSGYSDDGGIVITY